MKRVLFLSMLFLATFSQSAVGQEIFSKGEKAPNVNHTGDVWLNHISDADETFNYNISLATFAPGAVLNWHIHPAGQQLIITQGTGYYQERGEPVKIVTTGDVIKCLAGVEHWHGSTPSSEVAYLAITGDQPTKWLEKVSEEQYNSLSSRLTDTTSLCEEIKELSREKWQWMADKEVDSLDALFHEKAEFVHMGGTMSKDQELNVIKSGGIHYKKADIHEVSVKLLDATAILRNRITLLAVVGGNEVTNPFEVTEVYVKEGNTWKLANMSFTRLLAR